MESPSPDPASCNGSFATTHWSVVLAAAGTSSPGAKKALSELCATYWMPLYAFVRREGYSVEEAQDLTQEFFTLLVERNRLLSANPELGRFRAYLLGAMRHFLANEWDKAKAQKRGLARTISLDTTQAEACVSSPAIQTLSPERLYERRWALALLDQVIERTASDYRSNGREQLFEALKPLISADCPDRSCRDVAVQLHSTEGAVRVALHRLRQHYKQVLRAAVAETVASPDEIDEEIRYLFQSLGD